MGLFLESTSGSRRSSQADEAEARRKAEAKRKAEAEAKRKAEEARRKAEEARKKAAAEARKKAEAKKKEEAQAAAKRVSDAYKKDGDAAASAALRKEMAHASTDDRATILHAAKPVVDQIAEDIGLNARRLPQDWGKDGYEKNGSYSTDLKNKNPISSETEYQHTLQDFAAAVQLAGDKDAAFHLANTALQAMPDGKRSNTEKNRLGLFGDGLSAASADNHPLLLNATAVTLVDSEQKGPKGSELGQSMEKRNAAARALDPTIDDHLAIEIEDWTDEKGVSHDGHVWNEVSQNPDLFLTRKQREAIDEKYEGQSEAKIREIKTDQARLNMEGQHKGRDLDKVQDGEVLEYDNPDKDAGPKLDPAVKKAMDKSKTDHQEDRTYAKHLDRFAATEGFGKLDKDEQISAVKGYDRAISQSDRSGKELAIEEKGKLEELLTSKQLHKLNGTVQNRVVGLFGEFAHSEPSKLDKLQKMVDHSGLADLDNARHEMRVLEGYQNDSIFADAVDRLAGSKGLEARDRGVALERLQAIKYAGQLYGKSNDDEKKLIMDNAVKMVTSEEFPKFTKGQRTAATEYLVKYGDQEFGLVEDGYKAAIEKAGEIKVFAPVKPLKSPLDRFILTAERPGLTETKPEGTGKADKTGKTEKTEKTEKTDKTEKSDKTDKAESKLVTKEAVQADLEDAADNAAKFAKDDKTINDPLRRDAKVDPVDFAYKQLAQKHVKNEDYLKALNGSIDEFRKDYTTQEVKALFEKKDVDGALKTLNTQMEATSGAKQRKELFEAAGKPLFTKEFIRSKLDDALKEDDAKKAAGTLAEAYGENAPAEVADLAVDVFIEELKTSRSPLTYVDPHSVNVFPEKELFEGLSGLVERADQHGAKRADDMALVLKDKVLPGKMYEPGPGVRLEGPRREPGMAYGVEKAVENGNASLTIALINAYSDDPRVMNAKRDYSQGQGAADWNAHEFRNVMIRELDEGIEVFNDKTKGAVEGWQESNSRALALMNSFGRSDPEKAIKAIAADRAANPSGEEGGDHANTVDEKMEEVYEQGVKVYSLNQQLQGLKLDLDAKDADKLVRGLKDSIEKFTDPKNEAVQFSLKPGFTGSDAISLNPALQKYFDAQINFGTANEAHTSPLQGVYEQRDNVLKWVDDNKDKLPRAVAQNIRDEAAIWVTQSEDVMVDMPADADKKIKDLTADFQKKLDKHLEDQPVQIDNTPYAVKPSTLKGIEAWQKSGVVWRLSLNCMTATGEGLMASYSRRKAGRILSGVDVNTSSAGGKTSQNIARAMFADSALIQSSVDNIRSFQNKVQAEVSANNGQPLSKTRYKELMKEFWETHPNSNKEVKGYQNVNVGNSSHWQNRAGNVLRIAAFGIGAPVMYEAADKLQDKKSGYQLSSDQMYAWAFTTGAITESYKLLTGNGLGPQERKGVNGAPDKFSGLKWDFTRKLANSGPGIFLSVADTMWMIEDYQSDKKANAIGTTLLTVSDWVDVAAGFAPMAIRSAASHGLISSATAATAMGWVPIVGWIAAAGIVAGQVTRYATSLTFEKNKMEFDDNPRYAKMVQETTLFTEDQAKEWMNHSGGPNPQFWKGGVSPTHLLHKVFDENPGGKKVPVGERLEYMRSLSPSQIKKLVEKCHDIEDNEMTKSGLFRKDDLEDMKEWMKKNDLWKESYLGR